MRPLLLQQSRWRCLLWLSNLSKLIVAIVDVPIALVCWVEALLVVGGGVGRQLCVVEGGHVPVGVALLLVLLLLVGVVHPRLVGHSDPPLVLWPCRVFIPARERISGADKEEETTLRGPQ